MTARSDLLVQFGRRLRELRLECGLSQAGLAERVEMTPEYVSRIERGLVGPSMEALSRLALALGVEPKALFDFGGPRPQADPTLTRLRDLLQQSNNDDRRLLLRLAETVVRYRKGNK
ncbi:MAG TPA: helix-turn-helix transcriptional regulator [Polyangiaceae bacterium]|jgi:transcriptional regulator with XRE-family HTH domain